MRYMNEDAKLCLKEKGSPGKQPVGVHPWFDFEGQHEDLNIVFGHWSTLTDPKQAHLYPLDTGCLWGGKLTALKINSKMKKITSIDCQNQS